MKVSLPERQLIILMALALSRGLIYLALFPPWVAPDEPAHFEVIRIIGQEQQSPSVAYYNATPINLELSQSFQTFRMWELLERNTPSHLLNNPQRLHETPFIDYPYPGRWVFVNSYPILPHIILSPISYGISGFDIATELYILRLISTLLMVLLVALAWLISRRIFPQQAQFWLAIPAFIIFLPMHTHIFAAVNTDVFAIVLTSMLLLLLISFFDQDSAVAAQNAVNVTKTQQVFFLIKTAAVVSLVILAFLTKRTVIFTLLWVGLSAILYLGYRRRWETKRIVLISIGLLAVISFTLIWAIFNAEILGKRLITLFNMNIGTDFSAYFFFAGQQLSLIEFAKTYIKSGLFAFITFWGDFGGANINIPWPWAWGLMVICAVIVGAALWSLFKLLRSNSSSLAQRNMLLILSSGFVLSLLNAFFPVLTAGPGWGPPARYFFPSIIPIATFFFLGVRQLCPVRYRQNYLLYGWLLALITYDSLVINQILLPFLYG